MKEIILLKGYPNTGKSLALKDELPPLLEADMGKRKFWYKGKLIWIIRRSLHESHDWKEVLKKINNSHYEIIILPAWVDECVNQSKYINRTAESLISEYAFCCGIASTVYTIVETSEVDQTEDQKRCACEIFEITNTIINP